MDARGADAALAPGALAAERLGIYGGSFDPPHAGHLHVLRAARHAARLEHVVCVPAGTPPHKRERVLAPAEHRVALLELLLADEPEASVWRGEIERDGPSYSLDTVLALERARGGTGELFWILGSDSLESLSSWWRVEELLRRAVPLVVARGGEEPPASLAALSAAARARLAAGRVVVAPHEASSTELRRELAAGRRPPWMPEELFRYVRAHGLYGSTA